MRSRRPRHVAFTHICFRFTQMFLCDSRCYNPCPLPLSPFSPSPTPLQCSTSGVSPQRSRALALTQRALLPPRSDTLFLDPPFLMLDQAFSPAGSSLPHPYSSPPKIRHLSPLSPNPSWSKISSAQTTLTGPTVWTLPSSMNHVSRVFCCFPTLTQSRTIPSYTSTGRANHPPALIS